MSDDERVLRSFVADDEEWVDTWPVTKASFSKGHLPPRGGEETVAVNSDRVLWFTSELTEVQFGDLEEVEREYVEQQAAPSLVLGGGLLFVLGIFGSIGAFFANVGGTLVVLMPAITGLLVFLATNVVARLTGMEGEKRAGHRLRLWTDDEAVSIWGEEDPLAELEDAIGGGPDADADVDGSGDATNGDDNVASVDAAVDEDRDPIDESEATNETAETDQSTDEDPDSTTAVNE